MPKYTVEEVLEIIRSLTAEEQATLKTHLNHLLKPPGGASAVQQTRTMSVGGNFQVGGEGVTVDMSQRQTTVHGTPLPEASAISPQALMQAVSALHQQILNTTELNPVEKASVEVPIKTVAAELQKDQPDKSIIDQSIIALKKGLAGVETLAEPVMRVAALVAKAWIVL